MSIPPHQSSSPDHNPSRHQRLARHPARPQHERTEFDLARHGERFARDGSASQPGVADYAILSHPTQSGNALSHSLHSDAPRSTAQAVPISALLASPLPTGQQPPVPASAYGPAPSQSGPRDILNSYVSATTQQSVSSASAFVPTSPQSVQAFDKSSYTQPRAGFPGMDFAATTGDFIRAPGSFSENSHQAHSSEPPSAASDRSFFIPPTTRSKSPHALEYHLVMRQQPRAARACGFGERDRRVIDPPPIIEVRAKDPVTGERHLESDSYTTLHCVLINPATGADEAQITAPRSDAPSAQPLMGTAVASPWVADDEHGQKGSFFVFADLSVRSPGEYKLLFRLLKVNPLDISKRSRNYIKATIESDTFEVYTAKEFPGMRASSALLRALRKQGLNVGVKKGSDAKGKGNRSAIDNSDDGDEDGSESGEGGPRHESRGAKFDKGADTLREGSTGGGAAPGRGKRVKKG